MLEISYPFVFILLVLPFLFMLLSYKNSTTLLYFPNMKALKDADSKGKKIDSKESGLFARVILFIVYSLVVLALSKPILIQEPTIKEESLRDILVCVDLSASMFAKDFKSKTGENIDRLEAQKEVLGEFFLKRSGDNIGLIFYGSAAFIQSPFTSDTNATIQLFNEAQIGMAGPKTVIGDAIGLGIKLFDESKIKERMIILMSDGTDTGSKVNPLEVSKIAKESDLKVITIGVGDPNAQGNEKVDLKTLKEIAKITEGEFYFASDSETLENVYEQIDKMHPKKVQTQSYRNVKELFTYPLVVAFGILSLYLIGVLLFKRASYV
ncbi:MAG: VWA domain-containing protein [Campylobacterota bacterium]|nr:VWA domain-containing protein [Campylobacterota bacterium]